MQGYQVTFLTQQDRRHGHQPMHDWLVALARELGIQGSTVVAAAEGYGRAGRLHSVHFFELADQPMEVVMAMTQQQAAALFERLDREKANLFYMKTPVEYGVVGG
ncbi:MAG TPA: DUF190 domain-containing protein [Burkholderiales bacterium]|nr:DUF190 domain-containing protein [Burkholderiales bacterium]